MRDMIPEPDKLIRTSMYVLLISLCIWIVLSLSTAQGAEPPAPGEIDAPDKVEHLKVLGRVKDVQREVEAAQRELSDANERIQVVLGLLQAQQAAVAAQQARTKVLAEYQKSVEKIRLKYGAEPGCQLNAKAEWECPAVAEKEEE